MPDYEKMYHTLFNTVTDVIEILLPGEGRERLIAAQQECEEIYLDTADPAGSG